MWTNNKFGSIGDNKCSSVNIPFSDNNKIKICVINKNTFNNYLNTFDAYIIDYLNTKEFGKSAYKILLVEYKKLDVNSFDSSKEYLTYISSLTL